jgi:microcystin-dependent protein
MCCCNEKIPVGTVNYFARQFPPEGWLFCDGRAVSRDVFADLFNMLGSSFGSGDGSKTFNLPDLRGEFIRGLDEGRGVDSGREFGSAQKGTLVVSDPTSVANNVISLINSDDNINLMNQRVGADNPISISDYTGLKCAYTIVSNASPVEVVQGFGVTRPRNIALLACIKY